MKSRLALGLSLAVMGMPALAAPPTTPAGLRATVYSNTAAEIFWQRSSDDRGVVGYDVSLNGQSVGRFDALSYFTDELTSGQEYRTSVVAVNADGERSAAANTVFSAGQRGDTAPTNRESPESGTLPAPRNARLSVYSTTAAELFWEREPTRAGVVKTRVLRNGTLVRETAGISHFDNTRVAGQSYRYELIALDAAGNTSTPTVVTDAGSPVDPPPPVEPPVEPPVSPPATGEVFAASATDIEPDRSLYEEDGYATIDVIRVDLRTDTIAGPCTEEDLSGCTLADVIADTDKHDDVTVDIAVHFQATDFADDGSSSNAELRQRGGGSRFAPQKSFRVKLDSKEVLWRNERYLQLNKHPYESSRFRNKISFDLLQRVPHLPSLRTQFVNLWIDDGQGPVDNGLYTHVERINDDWLKRRGLPGDGNLYSAQDFVFSASDLADLALDEDGKPLNQDRFESSLEIEEGKDHRAVIAMLQAIQDPDLDFDTVLDRHFNRNNVLAWVTANLLMHQNDATRHNFKLYNPAGTERFYFIPWDYDAVFTEWQEPPTGYSTDALRKRLDYGYALGHRNDFLSRYYRMPGVHQQILAAVDVLRQDALTDTTIQEKSDQYSALVAPFETRAPDKEFNPHFNAYSGLSFARDVSRNEEAIRSRFSLPMPPTLLEPVSGGSQWRFRWTPAHEVTGNSLSYDLEIATSPDFSVDSIAVTVTGIADARGTVEQRVDADRLRSGPHYARLTARASNDPARYWQVAQNKLTVNDNGYLGMVAFEVP